VPAPLLLHDRQRRVRAVQEPEQVHVDHPLPVLELGTEKRAEQHDARVVEQYVDRPELVLRSANQRSGGAGIRHVRRYGNRLSTRRRDFVRKLPDPVIAPRSQRNGIALARKRLRRRLADPGRSTCHHCDSSHARQRNK
jgi:hypothetical protein